MLDSGPILRTRPLSPTPVNPLYAGVPAGNEQGLSMVPLPIVEKANLPLLRALHAVRHY